LAVADIGTPVPSDAEPDGYWPEGVFGLVRSIDYD
jgi:hypothetical protein